MKLQWRPENMTSGPKVTQSTTLVHGHVLMDGVQNDLVVNIFASETEGIQMNRYAVCVAPQWHKVLPILRVSVFENLKKKKKSYCWDDII